MGISRIGATALAWFLILAASPARGEITDFCHPFMRGIFVVDVDRLMAAGPVKRLLAGRPRKEVVMTLADKIGLRQKWTGWPFREFVEVVTDRSSRVMVNFSPWGGVKTPPVVVCEGDFPRGKLVEDLRRMARAKARKVKVSTSDFERRFSSDDFEVVLHKDQWAIFTSLDDSLSLEGKDPLISSSVEAIRRLRSNPAVIAALAAEPLAVEPLERDPDRFWSSGTLQVEDDILAMDFSARWPIDVGDLSVSATLVLKDGVLSLKATALYPTAERAVGAFQELEGLWKDFDEQCGGLPVGKEIRAGRRQQEGREIRVTLDITLQNLEASLDGLGRIVGGPPGE